MKYLIKYSCKQKLLIKIIINITVLLTLYNQIKQLSIANIQNNHTIQQTSNTDQINTKKTNDTTIKIQSDQASFYLTETVSHFSGNVTISFNKNILYADEIYLYKKTNEDEQTQIFLSGFGNVNYKNNSTHITGKKIIANIQNKNIDLYQGNFSFSKQKTTFGSAGHIKQRKNNRYTILKNTNFTTCPPHKKYWNISASQILYDHKNDNINIWNAYFKIKKIPILYIPYIQLSLPCKYIPEHHLSMPQYNNNKHGTEIKLPYHFNINNNIHGKITTNFIPPKNIQFQNHLQYCNNLNTGSIHLNLLNNHTLRKNYWLLCFYNNSYIQKKLHIKNEYIKTSKHNNFYNEKSKYTYIIDNYYIKKNMLWKYTDNIWSINLFYKEFQTLDQYIQNIYNTKPQININYHINKFKPFNYKIFSQITHFKNINHNYPKTIRLHIEPSINISSKILHTDLNTEIKLKNTHYQQKNIDFYNNTINNINKNIYLKKSVNRFLPEFKSNAKLILHKKTNIHSKHKQILEQKIQYLYIPYHHQNNIGLYDTTILETTEHTNLFRDTIYSGLDRISSANQLTSNVSTEIYDQNDTKLLYISLGQTYFFTPQRIDDFIEKKSIHKKNLLWGTNTYWKINQSTGIRSNFQYNTKIKKLKSGNTIIEYRTNNNKILQMNFRYLNSQYFSQITPEKTNSIYKKNITQIGIIGNWPVNTYWTFSGTQFYNVKNKHTINQTIGIQYHTCCWKINAGYEKKIHPINEKTNVKKYDNKLLFNITLSSIDRNSQTQSKTCNTLNTNTLPYQTILQHVKH